MKETVLSAEFDGSGSEEYIVELSVSGEVRFSSDEAWEFGLYEEGKEIDSLEICTAVLERRMKKYILPYSTYCRRTEEQIERKLRNCFCEKNGYSGIWAKCTDIASRNVISYLKEENYAGDEAYSSAFFRSAAEKNVSSDRLVLELVRRGIDRETAEKAAEEAGRDDEAACRRALEKKLGRYGPDAGEYRFSSEKEKASVIRFLLSRGFGIELIMRVINDHCSRDPEQEPEC